MNRQKDERSEGDHKKEWAKTREMRRTRKLEKGDEIMPNNAVIVRQREQGPLKGGR